MNNSTSAYSNSGMQRAKGKGTKTTEREIYLPRMFKLFACPR